MLARVWLAQVGRVRLYLLDTDLPRNREDDRWITAHVHGGDRDTRLRQDAGDFFTAHQHVAANMAFSTHTPVEAEGDTLPAELVDAYLGEYREGLGLSHEQFMSLGRRDPGAQQEEFSMTVLALRSARARRGVSDRTFVSGRPC